MNHPHGFGRTTLPPPGRISPAAVSVPTSPPTAPVIPTTTCSLPWFLVAACFNFQGSLQRAAAPLVKSDNANSDLNSTEREKGPRERERESERSTWGARGPKGTYLRESPPEQQQIQGQPQP